LSCFNATSCESLINNLTNKTACSYNFNGQGNEYQAVAGPVFILVYTFMGIFISYFADKFQHRRVLILSACLFFWSVMTLLTGFIDSYWQLVLLRFGLGFAQAGCTPLATSLISDYFVEELRGSALGIYNWGIYTGYSMSFGIGNPILHRLVSSGVRHRIRDHSCRLINLV
jgi:MFS family permease